MTSLSRRDGFDAVSRNPITGNRVPFEISDWVETLRRGVDFNRDNPAPSARDYRTDDGGRFEFTIAHVPHEQYWASLTKSSGQLGSRAVFTEGACAQ